MIDRIIQGDCLTLMKDIPDKSIDLVLTDPPFCLPNNQFRPEARIKQKTFGEFYPYKHFFSSFIEIIKNKLKKTGHVIIFGDESSYPVNYPVLYENFYNTKLIVWNKNRIGMGGIWRRSFELITDSYLLPQQEKSGQADIVVFEGVKNKVHNSQKPTELIEFILKKLTKEGDLILDPFLGSGTTTVACVNLKRHFIGIELSEEYVDIANRRVADAIYAKDSQSELALAGC